VLQRRFHARSSHSCMASGGLVQRVSWPVRKLNTSPQHSSLRPTTSLATHRHLQHCATPPCASLTTHHHLHRSLHLTAGAHLAHSCERVGTATGPPAAPAYGVGWVDDTSVADTVGAPHTTSPLCRTSHCLTGRSSSSASLPPPHRRCTPPTRASWLAPLVHLVHQRTAMGGWIKRVS
jgi:hypothetical protein